MDQDLLTPEEKDLKARLLDMEYCIAKSGEIWMEAFKRGVLLPFSVPTPTSEAIAQIAVALFQDRKP